MHLEPVRLIRRRLQFTILGDYIICDFWAALRPLSTPMYTSLGHQLRCFFCVKYCFLCHLAL